jgi:hypothetical protein
MRALLYSLAVAWTRASCRLAHGARISVLSRPTEGIHILVDVAHQECILHTLPYSTDHLDHVNITYTILHKSNVYTQHSSLNLSSQIRLDLFAPNDLSFVYRHTRYTTQSQAIDGLGEYLPAAFIPYFRQWVHVSFEAEN